MVRKFTYRLLHISLYLGLLCLVFACKSADITKSEQKTEVAAQLKTLLEKDVYYIELQTAFPFNTLATTQVLNGLFLQNTGNSASRVELSGEGNFIEISNDSVKGYLPFFGEQRFNAGSYGGRDLAIQFEGVLKDFEKSINTKKKKLEIEFSANHSDDYSERYDVRVELFARKNVIVHITPTNRTFIRYSGIMKQKDN
jgi:hypothetical protein